MLYYQEAAKTTVGVECVIRRWTDTVNRPTHTSVCHDFVVTGFILVSKCDVSTLKLLIYKKTF